MLPLFYTSFSAKVCTTQKLCLTLRSVFIPSKYRVNGKPFEEHNNYKIVSLK